MANRYTNLGGSSSNFSEMMQNGFAVVTVMNAKIFDYENVKELFETTDETADSIVAKLSGSNYTPICTLKTLKVANVSEEGPTKTVTGGQYSNPLVKFGKSARLEMQDALGNSKAVEALCGGLQEWNDAGHITLTALHFGEDFQSAKTILGDSFFIDRQTGQQVKVKIIFYQFLPDSLFNLTQDAEGDATVFDMNGDLLTTEVGVGTNTVNGEVKLHGLFYSIVDDVAPTDAFFSMNASGVISLESGYTGTLDGATVTSGTTSLAAGSAGLLVISDSNSQEVYRGIISR